MEENNNKKKISFAKIISIACVILALTQMICLSLGFKMETSIIIDILSCVIGTIVFLGFTDFDGDTENLQNLTQNIKDQITQNMDKTKINTQNNIQPSNTTPPQSESSEKE